MDTTRIKELAKAQGKTLSYVCQLIGRKVYYLNDLKKTSEMMAEEDLHIIAANLGTSVEYLKGETDDPNFHLSSVGLKTFPYEKSGTRPVYGHASAGLGVVAQQEVLGYEAVDPEHDAEDFFWLQVDGDSMSPVLNNRDLVLVQKDAPLETDTLVVVVIDDEDGYVKRVCIDEDSVTLHSYNPHYPPRVFGGSDLGRLRFMGKVVEMKRKF